MATNRTRKARGGSLDQWCRADLLHGPCLVSGCGYYSYDGDLEATGCDSERMASDWQRHKVALLSEWIQAHPGFRPYAWWCLESPQIVTRWGWRYCRDVPDLGDETELDFLRRHDLLEPGEAEAAQTPRPAPGFGNGAEQARADFEARPACP